MTPYRILILAADPLARAGLGALLDGQPECFVAGHMALGENLDAALDAHRPDVVLWDLGWDVDLDPSAADLDFENSPPVVALVSGSDAAPEAWIAGARGLLLRDTTARQITTAIHAVIAGLVVVDPSLVNALPGVSPLPAGPDAALTPREIEVLRLLAEGLANRAIAQRLAISEHTVKFHVNAILGKLHAQSRTEAVVHAIRIGVISV